MSHKAATARPVNQAKYVEERVAPLQKAMQNPRPHKYVRLFLSCIGHSKDLSQLPWLTQVLILMVGSQNS